MERIGFSWAVRGPHGNGSHNGQRLLFRSKQHAQDWLDAHNRTPRTGWRPIMIPVMNGKPYILVA